MKRWLLLMLTLSCCQAEILKDPYSGKPVRYAGNYGSAPVRLGMYISKPNAFRAAWVATVENLDFGLHTSIYSFQRDYIGILENLRQNGFNAIIFQIRPHCDAFYISRLNPWSRSLTGVEGRGLSGFDPLSFMIKEAKIRGLEFHAWLNPYRVIGHTKLRKSAYLRGLSPMNFARRHPEMVLETCTGNEYALQLDPGHPAVIQYLCDTIREIVNLYPVDAIHLDDYFYPYYNIGNTDNNSFSRFNPKRLSLSDWRRNNVNMLIYRIRKILIQEGRRQNRMFKFGISPFGIWANRKSFRAGSLSGGKESYFIQYADTRRWVRQHWIDYIIPQIYWNFAHPVAAFAAVTDFWCETVRGTNVKLYVGLGIHRLGSSGWSEWELFNQLRYLSNKPEVDGTVWFRYKHIFAPDNQIKRRGVVRSLNLR